MTLLSELIDIPEQVHKSDFVISLATAIHEPDQTLNDYVVTPQLAKCFDRALSLVTTAMADQRSKAAYLHASFGAGKTAMMAVLHLLLNGEPAARAQPELAPLVAKYAPQLDGRRFLLVPYHFIGKTSMEQVVLGGYVDHIQALHPGTPLPPVYVADGILGDTRLKRTELGDDTFFRVLSEGEAADEWGDYGVGWDAARFEAALDAPPGSSERDLLVGALLRTHYRALPGQAHATAEGFVPLDAGLDAISRHAKGLGYDAVVLFLDELVLWLESRMSEVAFVSREGNKLVKLIEADAGERPAPIVSFIARQRDLRELVGDHVLGPEALTATDVLRHAEQRFDTIPLEDRNLRAIAAKRLLRPRTEQARQLIDDAFDLLRGELDERHERDVLLTETGDIDAFRQLYPFSPALVDALLALSGAMQRERTALRVMLQLLVDSRERLELGQLIPLGDLWDVVAGGEEPQSEVMRAQFAQARRLWSQRFQPILLRDHGLDEDDVPGLDVAHAYVTDARLVKSLLVAAVVAVGPLQNMTVSRLTALNSGIVRAFIPGTERQRVLERLRHWSSEIGDLRLGEDEHDPTVSIVLTGIDTGPILEAARAVDSDGERRRRVKELLVDLLKVNDASSLDPWSEVTWRGTRRRVDVVFANVRDTVELPDEMLRAAVDPKLLIDYPWDVEEFGPSDDRGRVLDHRRERPPEWTAAWLPNFLTQASLRQLSQLVRLEYVLSSTETFERHADYLAPSDRAAARTQLANQLSAVSERVKAALRQAYGVDPRQDGVVEDRLPLGDQFLALDPSLMLQPPVGTSLRTHVEGIADQLLRHRFPKHPELTELVTRAELTHTFTQVSTALQQPGGRLENVEAPMRRVLTKVAGPLQLGTMYQAHFVAEVGHWVDLVERRRAEAGVTAPSVGQVRQWLDGADDPSTRRGLTREMSDLLVLLVAAATNRVVTVSGQPVARAEIGKLANDAELRSQDLPSEDAWTEALARAADIGIVPVSSLLSANTVTDLGQRLDQELVGDRVQAVRDLVPLIEAASTRLGTDGGDRLATAQAALGLVDDLRRRPDAPADALAGCDVPTTIAAIGTSIVQAPTVAVEVERTQWDLLLNAVGLEGQWAFDAASLRRRLVEGLVADELAVPLVARLREAARAASDLLSKAARAQAPAPGGSPSPAPGPTGPSGSPTKETAQPSDPPGGVGASVLAVPYDRSAAERALEQVRDRLRDELHLDLQWEIIEIDDDGVDASS